MSWQDRALCADVPLALFFPEDGDTQRARAICAVCPVWADCLAENLHEEHGVWGGLNRAERARLRRLRHRLATNPENPENPKDIRWLLGASMPPEHLAELLSLSVEQVIAYLSERRRRVVA